MFGYRPKALATAGRTLEETLLPMAKFAVKLYNVELLGFCRTRLAPPLRVSCGFYMFMPLPTDETTEWAAYKKRKRRTCPPC